MNPTQKQILRDALVAALVDVLPISLPFATLEQYAEGAGFKISAEVLEGELDYLVGKKLAELGTEPLSAGARRWKATATARDYCEGRGLA